MDRCGNELQSVTKIMSGDGEGEAEKREKERKREVDRNGMEEK